MEPTPSYLYKKDGEGNTIRFSEAIWKNEILHFAPYFENATQVLSELEENFQTREDDVWIFTYPKAGTHFLHEIVGIILSGKTEALSHFKGKQFLETKSSLEQIEMQPPPRLMNTHIRFKYLPKKITENNKIICCVRNPKSSAVSFYYHNLNTSRMEYTGTFNGFLHLFMSDEFNLYGDWFDYNIEMWEALHHKKNVLFVFYEEILKNPVSNIQKIADFLGANKQKDFCEKIAEITSFDKMAQGFGKDPEVLERSAFRKDGKITLFRKGSIDDWKNHFTDEQNQEFDKMYEEKMSKIPELKERVQFE